MSDFSTSSKLPDTIYTGKVTDRLKVAAAHTINDVVTPVNNFKRTTVEGIAALQNALDTQVPDLIEKGLTPVKNISDKLSSGKIGEFGKTLTSAKDKAMGAFDTVKGAAEKAKALAAKAKGLVAEANAMAANARTMVTDATAVVQKNVAMVQNELKNGVAFVQNIAGEARTMVMDSISFVSDQSGLNETLMAIGEFRTTVVGPAVESAMALREIYDTVSDPRFFKDIKSSLAESLMSTGMSIAMDLGIEGIVDDFINKSPSDEYKHRMLGYATHSAIESSTLEAVWKYVDQGGGGYLASLSDTPARDLLQSFKLDIDQYGSLTANADRLLATLDRIEPGWNTVLVNGTLIPKLDAYKGASDDALRAFDAIPSLRPFARSAAAVGYRRSFSVMVDAYPVVDLMRA